VRVRSVDNLDPRTRKHKPNLPRNWVMSNFDQGRYAELAAKATSGALHAQGDFAHHRTPPVDIGV